MQQLYRQDAKTAKKSLAAEEAGSAEEPHSESTRCRSSLGLCCDITNTEATMSADARHRRSHPQTNDVWGPCSTPRRATPPPSSLTTEGLPTFPGSTGKAFARAHRRRQSHKCRRRDVSAHRPASSPRAT